MGISPIQPGFRFLQFAIQALTGKPGWGSRKSGLGDRSERVRLVQLERLKGQVSLKQP